MNSNHEQNITKSQQSIEPLIIQQQAQRFTHEWKTPKPIRIPSPASPNGSNPMMIPSQPTKPKTWIRNSRTQTHTARISLAHRMQTACQEQRQDITKSTSQTAASQLQTSVQPELQLPINPNSKPYSCPVFGNEFNDSFHCNP